MTKVKSSSPSKWQPEIDFNQPPEALPIPEPPCRDCRFWRPTRIYKRASCRHYDHKSVVEFVGVRCCWAEKMYPDFSCFERKREG